MINIRILSLCLLAVLCGGCASPVAGLFPPPSGQDTVGVYVMRHGRHIGVILPTPSVPPRTVPGDVAAGYVEFGWGDQYYATREAPEFYKVLRALFIPTASCISAIPVKTHPEEYCSGNGLVVINVSTQGFQRMCAFVADTYACDPAGNAVLLVEEQDCLIYEAKGKYCFPKTSNVWAAQLLKQAGCPIVPARCVAAGPAFAQISKSGLIIRPHRSIDERLSADVEYEE